MLDNGIFYLYLAKLAGSLAHSKRDASVKSRGVFHLCRRQPAIERAFSFMDAQTAKRRFNQRKASAKRRGIGFELTFEQWLSVWGDKLDERGTRAHQYVMCRVMDKGPYALGNVSIGKPKNNAHTRRLVAHDRRMLESWAAAAQSTADCPPDPTWEEQNPWLPEEFELKSSYSHFR